MNFDVIDDLCNVAATRCSELLFTPRENFGEYLIIVSISALDRTPLFRPHPPFPLSSLQIRP